MAIWSTTLVLGLHSDMMDIPVVGMRCVSPNFRRLRHLHRDLKIYLPQLDSRRWVKPQAQQIVYQRARSRTAMEVGIVGYGPP
jgi:hypothetical protein